METNNKKTYHLEQVHKVLWTMEITANSEKEAIEKAQEVSSGWKETEHIHAQNITAKLIKTMEVKK